MARVLAETELRAWQNIVEVELEIHQALEAELVGQYDVSLGEYGCLVELSDSPGRRLRMTDLAERMRLSPSGLTRRLDRLVARGVIARVPSGDDRRVTLAVLTDDGIALLSQMLPDHHDAVRRHFISHLTVPEILQIESILASVLQRRQLAGLSFMASWR